MTQMLFRPWMMTVGISVMAAFFLVGCATPYGGAMVSENPVTVAPTAARTGAANPGGRHVPLVRECRFRGFVQ